MKKDLNIPGVPRSSPVDSKAQEKARKALKSVEVGPQSLEEEQRERERKEERKKKEFERRQREKREAVEALKKVTGTPLKPEDLVYRKLVNWDLKSNTILCCKYCGRPVAKDNVKFHEKHKKTHEFLAESGLLNYCNKGKWGSTAFDLIDIVRGEPKCKYCGERITSPDHYDHDGNKLECPKVSQVEERANRIQRKMEIIENGGRITSNDPAWGI